MVVSTGKASQLNVRIDPVAQQAGNAALAELGLSPSEAVRALWEKAGKGGKDLLELQRLLFPEHEPSATKEKLRLARAGQQLVADGLGALGVDAGAWPLEDFPSYNSVVQKARLDQLRAEGIIHE